MVNSACGLPIMHAAWLPPDAPGGYRTRVVEEARLLVELGHQVELAAFGPPWAVSDDSASRMVQAELQRQTGADVHVLPTSHFFDLSPSPAADHEILEPLARLVRDRGVRIIHGQACYAAAWGLQVARRVPGLKVAFDCHGISPEETRMTGGHEARAAAVERLERELLSTADLVVLVSHSMGRHFTSKYGIRPRNRVTLPCCVDLSRFGDIDGQRRQARESLGFDEQSVVIVYAGTLSAWQWPIAMFRAFAQIRDRLPRARLLLLVPQRDHGEATRLLHSAGLDERACVLQEVSGDRIGGVLPAGDAGLLLRQDHPVNLVSSPTKFGEYLAAGVPVVATAAVGDFSAWIRDRHVGLVVPASDDGLPAPAVADLCAFLDQVKADRQAWSLRCRDLALERLDWHLAIKDLSRAYQDLIGPAGTGVPLSEVRSDVPVRREAAGQTRRPLHVLFNGHDLKFARNLIAHFSGDPRYEVRIDEWQGHDVCDGRRCEKLLAWADVLFCEWCLGNARWYSQRKRPEQKLFVRLHSQEMNLPYRYEMAWENVDRIIFINFQHHATFCYEQPEHAGKAIVIFNDVDCRALDQPKFPGAEFNLGLVGICPQLKRPDLALEILSRLREVDPRYVLSIKGRMPWEYRWLWARPHEREYFAGFFSSLETGRHCNSVIFDSQGDDMPLWYSKIGFVLSTSDREGSHQAVAEGMAAGCVPIVRDWEGATPLYPASFVFSSPEEAVELIRRFADAGAYAAAAAQAKAYARRYFDTSVIVQQLEALFAGVEVPGFDGETFGVLAAREEFPRARCSPVKELR